MLCLALGMAQEVETICTGGLQLGWLGTLTMVICDMRLTPQLFQLHLSHSHFRASPPFFAPSVAADTVHVMWGKTKDSAYNSGNCHTQPTYSPQCFSQTDTSWTHCILSADGLQEEVNQKSSQSTSPVDWEGEKRNCFCCSTSLDSYVGSTVFSAGTVNDLILLVPWSTTSRCFSRKITKEQWQKSSYRKKCGEAGSGFVVCVPSVTFQLTQILFNCLRYCQFINSVLSTSKVWLSNT